MRLTKARRYLGDGYHYVICDVCGFKVRQKECVLITDKYNYLNGLLVCKKDYEESNPQDRIRSVTERQIHNPRLIREESTDRFLTEAVDQDDL